MVKIIMDKKTTVKIKKGYVVVSTVALSNILANDLDKMGLGNDNAVGMNFETMVFASDEKGKIKSLADLDVANYLTEKEAKLGHKTMVEKWESK